MIKYIILFILYGIVMLIVSLIVIYKAKQANSVCPCDTCDNLRRKTKGGMSEFKYLCKESDRERSFDRPPIYCAFYRKRGDNEDG